MSTVPRRERSDTPKVPRGLRERSQNFGRVTVMRRSRERSQNSHRTTIWERSQRLSDERIAREVSGLGDTILCETSVKNGSWRSFCAAKVVRNGAHVWDHLELAPGLSPYRKNHKCGHTVWGKKFNSCRFRELKNAGNVQKSRPFLVCNAADAYIAA